MKSETFTRIKPWYELTPTPRFIYQDKQTKLWFVIESLGRGEEIQGAGYAIITAYKRYCESCQRGKRISFPLDDFTIHDKIEQVMSYQVRH